MAWKSGLTSVKKGEELQEETRRTLEERGFKDRGKDVTIVGLNPFEFKQQPRIQGRWCKWQPDFAARTACGKILIIECKNTNPNDCVGISMDVEYLVTRFYDIRNNAQNSDMSFIAVWGKEVDLETAHKGFTALLQRDLGVRITSSARLAELLNSLK